MLLKMILAEMTRQGFPKRPPKGSLYYVCGGWIGFAHRAQWIKLRNGLTTPSHTCARLKPPRQPEGHRGAYIKGW